MQGNNKKIKEVKKWKAVTVTELLELTSAEEEIIELRLTLSRILKDCRREADLTQTDAAKKLKTSQSRIAKMEAADESVSLDLLISSLFNLGFDRKKLAKAIA